MKSFCGFKYDDTKVDELFDVMSENESLVPDLNDQYADEKGIYDHYTVCQLCGRVIVHSIDGYGTKCHDTIKSLIPIVAKINPDFQEKISNYNLKRWIAYANTIRKMYIINNTNENGEPKKFRSDFKKSFFKSMQQAERLSRKQVDVMIKDLVNADYYAGNDDEVFGIDFTNRNQVIGYFDEEERNKLNKEWHDLIEHEDSVALFARITYKRAWIDNPLKDEKIEIECD